jgi:hypothetical protein
MLHISEKYSYFQIQQLSNVAALGGMGYCGLFIGILEEVVCPQSRELDNSAKGHDFEKQQSS